jgi:HEAT repeat protein
MAELREVLAELLSGHPERAERAAVLLPQFQQQAIHELSQLAHDPSAETRWWAIRALAEFDSEEAAAALITTALGDSDNSVRQCAALALAKHPQPAAIPALITLLNSSDGLLARLAGDALIATGSEAVPALVETLADDSLQAQTEAARALALIGDTRAVSALFKLLDSDSVILEHWASQGLEKMGIGMHFFQP